MFSAYTRPSYQVSVYRTIGPLVINMNIQIRSLRLRPWVERLCLSFNFVPILVDQ